MVLIISKVRRAEKDDLEASDSILQISHILGRKSVK